MLQASHPRQSPTPSTLLSDTNMLAPFQASASDVRTICCNTIKKEETPKCKVHDWHASLLRFGSSSAPQISSQFQSPCPEALVEFLAFDSRYLAESSTFNQIHDPPESYSSLMCWLKPFLKQNLIFSHVSWYFSLVCNTAMQHASDHPEFWKLKDLAVRL